MKKIAISIIAVISLAAIASVFLIKNNKLSDFPALVSEPLIFDAGSPHYGPLIKTEPLEITYNNKLDLALTTISPDQTKRMKKYQSVILYGQEGNILPYGGKISLVSPHKKGADLVITLPKNTNTEFLKESVEIITSKTIASPRLPLSALQQDENGQSYVWIASKKSSENATDNQYNIRRQYIKDDTKNDDYIGVNSQQVGTYDLVLFDPNDTLSSDQVIQLNIIDFKAPLHDPIRQAWIDADIEKMRLLKAEMAKKIEECERRKNDPNYKPEREPQLGDQTTVDGPQNAGCGVPADTPEILKIFDTLN